MPLSIRNDFFRREKIGCVAWALVNVLIGRVTVWESSARLNITIQTVFPIFTKYISGLITSFTC